MASWLAPGKQTFIDENGFPLAAGQIFHYIPGTSGGAAPSHTAGFALDGTVVWEFIVAIAAPVFSPSANL